MRSARSLPAAACAACLALAACAPPRDATPAVGAPGKIAAKIAAEAAAGPVVEGVLCDPASLTTSARAGGERCELVVLEVREDDTDEVVAAAAARVRALGRQLGYWFEVGRDEALAAAHPEWLATLQGHDEWRCAHSGAAHPGAGEVVVAWPWVPVGYAEAFAAHRDRIARRLAALPAPDLVLLNDLQGPPSACGCGNVLCRWATDYTLGGAPPRRSATPLGPEAAARFVGAVQALVPDAEVVPVWVTECEREDTAEDGACHGVGCYDGACWREFERQWVPLRAASATTALLLPYRAFGRDLARFDGEAGWVRFAIEHLRAREGRRRRELPGASLIAVLQGWGEADVAAQVAAAGAAGVRRVLIAEREIAQGLEPRLRASAGD